MAKRKPFPKQFEVTPFGAVQFKGVRWLIGVAPLRKHGVRGTAMVPHRKGLPGAVVVSTHIRPGSAMCREALIHEALHIAFPKATEKAVADGAHFVAKVLAAADRALVAPTPEQTGGDHAR